MMRFLIIFQIGQRIGVIKRFWCFPMNGIHCACCGSSNSWSGLLKFPKFIFGARYEVYVCEVCGCGCTFPQPKLNESFYENNGRYSELFLEHRNLYLEFAYELLETLEPLGLPRGSKLLDIGCGSGALVEAAEANGFCAKGIDSNKNVVDACRANGLDIYNIPVNKIPSVITEKQDVIVFSAVLEHLPDPYNALRAISKILSPNGCILISQADYTGMLPRLFPWFWYGWQPEEHYWHFSSESIATLVCRAGFKVSAIRRHSLYHPWTFDSNPKRFVGKNSAAAINILSNKLKRFDSFDLVAVKGVVE